MSVKLAHFIGWIQDGGAETLVRDYSLLIDKEKFNVSVIVLNVNEESANYKIMRDNGVRIIRIYRSDSTSLIYRMIRKLNRWWYVPARLRRILSEEGTEVLHIHLTVLRYLKPISGRLKNVRLFYTSHSKPCIHLGVRAEYAAARYLIKHNGLRMIALHDAMRREINEMFGITNTVVIHNGIDVRRFADVQKSKDEVQKELGIKKGSFVVGHIGRFDPVKNHSFLIDVFDAVCKRRNDAFLLLVGDGSGKEEAETKLGSLGLQGRYLILSHRPDIPQLMRAMDVFVFPSLYEGLPLALIEAQVSGLRCAVSDAVPQEAFVTELAVPVSLNESAERWCDIILDDTVKGTAHGSSENYDMNKEIKRLEKLYLGEINE